MNILVLNLTSFFLKENNATKTFTGHNVCKILKLEKEREREKKQNNICPNAPH